LKGPITYWHANGNMAKKGIRKDDVRIGIWEFWDELGNKTRETDYTFGEKLIVENGDTTTIPYLGTYKRWFANGNKAIEGLILTESSLYACGLGSYQNTPDLFYLNTWLKNGKQSVKDGDGFMVSYQVNELIEGEGKVHNGLKQGLWKFRDPNGNVNSMGSYKDGEKDGKWVSGDLDAMKFLDMSCFYQISDEQLEQLNGEFSVKEIIYSNGREINSVEHFRKATPVSCEDYDQWGIYYRRNRRTRFY